MCKNEREEGGIEYQGPANINHMAAAHMVSTSFQLSVSRSSPLITAIALT